MTKASDVERRLQRLERQNRRLRLVVYSGLVAVVGAVAMAQTRPSQTIEAERFVVRDRMGNQRAVLGLEDDAPRLALYAPGQEIESVWLGMLNDVPILTLQRVGGSFQAQLTQGLFFVRGANGSFLADVETVDASGGMSLRDRDGQTRVRINWPGREASLGLYEPSGEARIVAAIDGSGTASLTLPFGGATGAQLYSRRESLGLLVHDPQGRMRIGLDAPSSGIANIGVFDEEGRTLFGVP